MAIRHQAAERRAQALAANEANWAAALEVAAYNGPKHDGARVQIVSLVDALGNYTTYFVRLVPGQIWRLYAVKSLGDRGFSPVDSFFTDRTEEAVVENWIVAMWGQP